MKSETLVQPKEQTPRAEPVEKPEEKDEGEEGGGYSHGGYYTHPEEAVQFVKLTGVDSLAVKWGESGEVIRFTYRVLDADKAKVLNDKTLEPSLIDPQAGVKLVVPSMENVGQLRQSALPENGKSYWMVFSNKGRLVKRGDHVSVVIGAFHADGLVVD